MWFHWLVYAVLGAIVVLAIRSRRSERPSRDRDRRPRCNVCGTRFDPSLLVEREVISGYTYYFCDACIDALQAESVARRKGAAGT
ncbi:hypothetical protein FJZ36_02420 [Candidatus Poribacteria bacterium]|nr:hypothetical protein [Candidatus Poribacteria bacterium]